MIVLGVLKLFFIEINIILISGIPYGNACPANADSNYGCQTILACVAGQCYCADETDNYWTGSACVASKLLCYYILWTPSWFSEETILLLLN